MADRQGILFFLCGPSGSGKSFFAKRLIEASPELTQAVTVTTRAPRAGEVDHVSYSFVSVAEFQTRRAAAEFFEWEQVHDNFYGSPKAPIEAALSSGKDLLLQIDIKGALNYKKSYPTNAVITFLVPPSPQILLDRLNKRGAMSAEESTKRLKTAEQEYSKVLELSNDPGKIDYLVVNDRAEQTFSALSAIYHAEKLKLVRFGKKQLTRLCSL